LIHINFTIFSFDGNIARKIIKYDKKHEHELDILWENTCSRLKNSMVASHDDLVIFLGYSIISKIRQREMTWLNQDELFDEMLREPAISGTFTQIREILLEAVIDDRPKQVITVKQQREIGSEIS
jgi:hypothetical protein